MNNQQFDDLTRIFAGKRRSRRHMLAVLGALLTASALREDVVAADSETRVVVLLPPPNAPKITDGPAATNLGQTSAAITWVTDQTADSRVDYGTTKALGQTLSSHHNLIHHKLTLNGLEPGTTYHYQVHSTNANGEASTKRDRMFTTPLCEGGLQPCAGTCVDVTSDPANCGNCGYVCEDNVCNNGVCTVPISATCSLGDPCSVDADCCTTGLACKYRPDGNSHCVQLCQTDADCATNAPCVVGYCGPQNDCLFNNTPGCGGTCAGESQACTKDVDCCQGFACQSGLCTAPRVACSEDYVPCSIDAECCSSHCQHWGPNDLAAPTCMTPCTSSSDCPTGGPCCSFPDGSSFCRESCTGI